MMGVLEPNSKDLEALRQRLVRAAMAGEIPVPRMDAEDVAQDALLKVVTETPDERSPSLVVRGFSALKQAKVDYVRRRTRAKDPPLDAVEPLDEQRETAREDAGLRMVELSDVLLREVGGDSLDMARARAAKLTEREVGELPGWTPQRAQAARRRLKRGAKRIFIEIQDD